MNELTQTLAAAYKAAYEISVNVDAPDDVTNLADGAATAISGLLYELHRQVWLDEIQSWYVDQERLETR